MNGLCGKVYGGGFDLIWDSSCMDDGTLLI